MAASTEMSRRRNMLLVAFVILGLSFSLVLSYLLTKDLRKIQKDVDLLLQDMKTSQ